MRVLLDQGLYDMRNVGNMAMLLVTADRLRKRWPQALYEIITYGPHLSKIYFPYAHPVNPFNPFEWSQKLERYNTLHLLTHPGFHIAFTDIKFQRPTIGIHSKYRLSFGPLIPKLLTDFKK